ncbi:MAG: YqgE/AlgH family protein [Thermodesulfobacteriota bacterium]
MKTRYLNQVLAVIKNLYLPIGLFIVTLLFIGLARSPLLHASLDKGKELSTPRSASSVPLSKGKFLVARGAMRDPHFHKAVIYLIDYNPLGALGVVINRPTKVKLSEALPEVAWLQGTLLPLSWGGPVEKSRLTILALSKSPLFGTEHMAGDLYAGWDVVLFKDFFKSGSIEAKAVRAFGGYAGWAPGQLDGEVARGGWRVMDASVDDIFRDTTNLWFKLMGRP